MTLALGNVTTVLIEGKDNPRGRLARIEVIVCLTAALLAFLIVFGSFRRRSYGSAVRLSIWAAYVTSYSLISYAVGLMQSAPFHNELFTVWAVFLLIVLGSADSISAYSLEDNEQRWRHYSEILLQTFWVSWLIAKYSAETKFKVPLWLLWVLSMCKAGERIASYASASRKFGLVRYTKLVADFMTCEPELSKDSEIDPTQMKGYHYLIRGEKQSMVTVEPPTYQMRLKMDPEIVTVQKVWECEGRLLKHNGDPDGRLKDICLSYALVKLLRRRFAGYPFVESSLDKTWRLVRDGLLDDPERTFRVIEVELAFLYDFFYTKYPVIFIFGFPTYKAIEIIMVVASSWIAVSTLDNYQPPEDTVTLVTSSGTNLDVLVTRVVVLSIAVMQFLQLLSLLFSDWATVVWVCKYISNHSNKFLEKVVQFFCHRRHRRCFNLKPWTRQLGQYSLLLSYHHNPPKPLDHSLTSTLVYQLTKGFSVYRIKLHMDVKKAVLQSLKANGRLLSNGLASLQQNRVDSDLGWACQLETHTHCILVWHIATTLCEIAPLQSQQGGREVNPHFRVASSISNYCSYLVASVPNLLPDHFYVIHFIFDRVVEEVNEILKGCKGRKKKYEEMMKKGETDPKTITAMGVKLAKELMDIGDQELRWKVLADFWAEMILFLAPSDNATSHAEQLVNGGEFLTHLWTLLSHAGILRREEDILMV
ncbi:uncharacterized protein LOC122089116 [Macadamia integrifolia]|uniref:uncharacterized protein LOC122089116 n=1 Tax=Macadamia integrifolia TaxID=60698 RepID=UPI001C4ED4B7|nr:uncharacterized protein LOC122089116 [Macadamia integrifolia]XP_042514522.1 uncharacterized protein LOC122089116 [Macadamia integrifolia]XP_042514523.1 uncharacterized protein LOC122089116 [Macadamia integrifolia]XP_042514524.1 uncharacterized protein LOC122089116 [Macadamia integrifolia]XP_042514525.1 uncharacterized protein LOC122089116 [Macadamia integrifolia]XP_042514526.1 uncharacterized protein LOC122089116 [Macadamia integrifolia]XP_042514527.1 uncharacterized protein LOC122089116 [